MNLLRFGLVALLFLPAAHAQSPAAARMQPVAPPVVKPVPGPKIVVAPPVQKKPIESKPPFVVPVGKPEHAGKPPHAGKPDFVAKPGGPLLTPLDDKATLDQQKLQDSMQKQTRAQQTRSNVLKKNSDTQQGIVQNIK